VINPSALLREFETRYARESYRGLSYLAALDLYTGLWVEARLLNPGAGHDWERNLATDFAVARAINGLPPHS